MDFSYAQCQEADFEDAQCQGAYAAETDQLLSDRIGKATELENMIIAGEFSEDDIQSIEGAKEYCSGDWYVSMQGVIKENEGKGQERGVPRGIMEGILEDSTELQAIIKELEDIWESSI